MKGLTLGQKVRQARISQGMSQQDLADKIGVTRGRISQIEIGIEGNPSMDVVRNICKFLGITEWYLLKEEVPEKEGRIKTISNMLLKLNKRDLDFIEYILRYMLKEAE